MTLAHGSVVDRDPALSGLTVLLEAPALRGWLSEHGVDPTGAAPTYLRYKPGTSLTAALTLAAGPALGYAVAPHAVPKIEKLVRRAPDGSVLAYDPQQRVLVARPSADRDLPGLRSIPMGQARTLAYKPQRRWVGLVPGAGDAASCVLRCYRPSDLLAAAARWPGVGGPIRVPEVRETDRRRGVLTLEQLPGRRLSDLTGGRASAAWHRTGSMLARWHAEAGPAPGPVPQVDLEAVALEVARLLPDEADRAVDLAARVATDQADADTGWCHGDFSADQVLIDEDGRPALLDWDRSGFAPRSMDLASADAGAELDDGAVTGQWEALLAGYTEVRAAPPGLDRARARAHFLRVTEPFRHADPEWPARVRRRLDRVETIG